MSIIAPTASRWPRSYHWRPDDVAAEENAAEPTGIKGDVPAPSAIPLSVQTLSRTTINDRIEHLASQILSILTEERGVAPTPDSLAISIDIPPNASETIAEKAVDVENVDDLETTDFFMGHSRGQDDLDDMDSRMPTAFPTTEEQTLPGDFLAADQARSTVSIEHHEPDDDVTPGAELDVADVLHVGCGAYDRQKLPPVFLGAGWREIRLDIDPEVDPDFVASMTDMSVVSDGVIDAVYSSHNVEHLYPHEVPLALREMFRVLKPTGFALIRLPDLQEVARHVTEGRLEEPLYISAMGPVSPLDILYGHRPSLARGNAFMSHRTGFTQATLGRALIEAGFAAAMVQRNLSTFSLAAIAFRARPDESQMESAQAHILPNPDLPAVLYARAG